MIWVCARRFASRPVFRINTMIDIFVLLFEFHSVFVRFVFKSVVGNN